MYGTRTKDHERDFAMAFLQHDTHSGPMNEQDAHAAFHQTRAAVQFAKLDRDFDQISEFQRFVRWELDRGNAKPMRPEVKALAEVIEREPFVRMYAREGLAEIPWTWRHFDSVDQMLQAINYVTWTAPIFRDVNSISWQFPLSALMNFWMMTPSGKQLMRMPQFNDAINDVMAAWCRFLDSPESLYVLNDGPTGWLNQKALEYNRVVEDYEIPDRDAPHWGWKSYNDFFHRMVRADQRPVDEPDSNRVINSPNDGVAWAIEHYAQRDDAFWLKTQVYSLGNMLNQSPFTERFVGGTVFQTYVNGGADWHGFTAPINGVVKGVDKVRGYCWSESDVVGPDPMSGPYSQGWAAGVASRAMIYIDSGDATLGIVCVIPIGLTEVSSLDCFVKEGDAVKKGDVLGQFSFGGSSFALIFQPGAVREILVKPPLTGRNAQPEDTLRANKRCAIANLDGDGG